MTSRGGRAVPIEDSGVPVTIKTARGNLGGMLHHQPGNRKAAVMVGGIDGGFDGPADGIYRDLGESLLPASVSSLRLDFRVHGSPGNLQEAELDVVQGISYLNDLGIEEIALMGHSFGAAVVITVAAERDEVKAVVTLSAQTYGTRHVAKISPRPILLIHGQDDQRLPPSCSEYIYARAGQPKELVILPGARHSLRQKRGEVFALVRDWLLREMRAKD